MSTIKIFSDIVIGRHCYKTLGERPICFIKIEPTVEGYNALDYYTVCLVKISLDERVEYVGRFGFKQS